MKVLLLKPYGMESLFVAASFLVPNLKRAGHTVVSLDCLREKLDPFSEKFHTRIQAWSPDVIGIPYWTIDRKCVEETLASLKTSFPSIKTVVGGPHPSVVGEAILRNDTIDFAVRGEGEFSLPLLLEKLSNGSRELQEVPGLVWRDDNGQAVANAVQWIEDLDSVGLPEYEHLHLEDMWKSGYDYGAKKGVKNAPIYATRGCPYICQFCSTPLCMGRSVRTHSPEYMVRVIDHLYEDYKVRHFNFIDDNFTFYRDYVRDLCQTILKWGKPGVSFFAPQGVRIEHLDREILTLMKQIGWDTIVVAPESGSLNTLQRMKKKMKPDLVLERVKLIRSVGLHVVGFFIIGYPGETWEDIHQTVEFADKCDFDGVFFNKFQPLPGTPIFDELVASGELREDYIPTDYHGVQKYAPAGINPRKLHWFHNYATYRYHLKSFHRLSYVLKRKSITQLLKVILKDHQLLSLAKNYLRRSSNEQKEPLIHVR